MPDHLDVIEVPAGTWAVFRTSGADPAALQDTYAASASEWFPLEPAASACRVLDRAEDFSTATTELWVPIERA